MAAVRSWCCCTGSPGSSSTWLPVMSLLGAHAHVIAPDLLGHGLSAKPHDGDYSLGAYAADLRTVPGVSLVGEHLNFVAAS